MATLVTIGGDNRVFLGTDLTLRFEILDTDEVPVDCSGWTVSFDLRRSDHASTALVTKTASITGTYNAVRATNTQRALVVLDDDDLSAATLAERTYRWSLKRLNSGSEVVLSFGSFKPERVTQI